MAKKPTKRSAEFAKQVKAGTAKKRKAKPAKQRKKAERVYSYKPRPQEKKKEMPSARGGDRRPKRPPPTGPEMDAVAREVLAAAGPARLEAVRRGERRLAAVESSRAGVPAAAPLARAVRDARLSGCSGSNGEKGLEDAARQAWRAQRILLQPALHVARQANSEGKAALRGVVDEGVKAFATILGDALQSNRVGQAHELLMALGDLERYRETLVDNGGHSARVCYLRALRLKPAKGRAAGNVGALCDASDKPEEAAHWYLRAGCAREPYGDAPKALRRAAAEAQRRLTLIKEPRIQDAEAYLAAAACAVCHGPRERAAADALMELERAGGQARAVLRRTVSKSAADDLARVVATAVVLARRAAVTCDAPTVAAAHLVCDQICEAALDGALANDATKRRAAPAALVAMRWLAATTYRAPKGKAAARLAEFARACPANASSAACSLDDDLRTAGVFEDAPCLRTTDVTAVEKNVDKCHAERCRRLVALAAEMDVKSAPAPFRTSDMAGVLDALGVAPPPPPAPAPLVQPSAYEPAPRDRAESDLLQAAASAHLAAAVPAPPAAFQSSTEARRPWTRPRSPAAQPEGRRSPVLPEPGLAPDARRPWSRPAQRPAPPAPCRAI